ncbi:HNH endonuclease signature motif containing protein [Streptomyces sp. SPB4]|uniref:HNH endonuclease n=1 Tax=Streptomyces sp. SPB4 TaxID=2940553 RepID=UPI002476E105|nr:HNH endonuclease signature motif containing protein [Streptomyces sp. SPB4]MDH6545825.1 5-methylcytosine-specific restriction endonuclease McrA [Streptomyces sp. SPB4]
MSGSRDHQTGAKSFQISNDQPRSRIKRRVDPGIALRYAVERTQGKVEENEQVLADVERGISRTGRPVSFDARAVDHLRKELDIARAAHLHAVEELLRWEDDNLQGAYAADAPVGEVVPVAPDQPGSIAQGAETMPVSARSSSTAEALPAAAGVEYRRLVELVEEREADRYGVRVQRTSSGAARDAAARRAVLLRAAGRCENPACGGQPKDVTDEGAAILEVDHIWEIAKGGRDHPVQMVALCPNCHAMKGRGRNREALRKVLLEVAHKVHTAWSPTAVSQHPGVRSEGRLVDSIR